MAYFTNLHKKLTSVSLLALVLFTWSCSDDDSSQSPSTVKISFQHTFDSQPLVMGQEYTNAHGHKVKFTKLRYYISNVKFTRADGSEYVAPNSYHLLEKTADTTKESFALPEVPAGTYQSITFSVGVDPAHNHSTDQVGDLDPNHEMAWNWDTGYKFLVAEGQYYNTAEASFRNFIYHIGHDENYRTITFIFPTGWNLNGQEKTIHLNANTKTLFGGPNVINLSTTGFSTVMGGANAFLVADNITQMFQLK